MRVWLISILLMGVLTTLLSCKEASVSEERVFNELTAEEVRVILQKGTEAPYSGEYNNFYEKGVYQCKRCDSPLYRSEDKFNSRCGWPSFDDEIEGAVKRLPDADGMRVEILCANCDGHLGHVFTGEGFTEKNVRHCVNSISMTFVPDDSASVKTATFAGGCFWGVEHLFQQQEGVISAVSGYMGGRTKAPSYQEVIHNNTGHLEVVQVSYDASKVSYETLARLFFEIHDPTQSNGQGPDIGEQYLSAVFYETEEEAAIVRKLIRLLKAKGYDVVTQVRPVQPFWEAEGYHQDYYVKTGKAPYCHVYQRRF